MHAVVISEPGGPDVLRWTEVPDPVAGPGEVLVNVAASAVNRADMMQRQGFYDPPKGASPYPGLECSGTIEAVGAGVTGWQPGDQVCALLSGGGYAEKVAVPAGQLLPVPKTTPLVEAAALPETVCTVYSNVFMGARLTKGETLLIHGGGSGIGTTAIQLGKHVGATVAVTAGSQEKLDACKELGADILINYREDNFAEKLMELTDGHGADVILDIIGAGYLAKNLAALAFDGRIVSIGLQQGRKAELDMGLLMAKRGTIMATTLRARPAAQKASIVAAVKENVWPLVDAGALRPVIHRELPMAQADEAHRIMTASTHTGKIVLVAQTAVLSGGQPVPLRGTTPEPPGAGPHNHRHPIAWGHERNQPTGPGKVSPGRGRRPRRHGRREQPGRARRGPAGAPDHRDGRAAGQGHANRLHDPPAA
jgi:putative PIG3 family NAD(P)H quinone oxidoreductase